MVRSVRRILWFQTYGTSGHIHRAALAPAAAEEIRGVQSEDRQVGADTHLYTGGIGRENGGGTHAGAVDDVAVVIAADFADECVIGVYPVAYDGAFPEIEGGTGNVCEFAGGYGVFAESGDGV